MSDHQHSADIDAPADKLFDYLSEIRKPARVLQCDDQRRSSRRRR